MILKNKRWLPVILAVAVVGAVLAGDVYTFKCARKSCSFTAEVMFGGTMSSERAMGWCHTCRAFKSVTWTRVGSPLLEPGAAVVPPPEPVAEVWVSTLGEMRKVYRCPDCKGYFLEIRGPAELTHCPKCGDSLFSVDSDAPHIAVD